MSSLLQNVLASRLAQASLASDAQHSDVEVESTKGSVVGPSSSNLMPPPTSIGRQRGSQGSSPTQALDEWENVESNEATSDDEYVGVYSLPGTVPGTPHISRPPSPGAKPPGKRSQLSRGTGAAGFVSPTASRKSKTDPLRSLPKELSQRIFLSLPISALIALSMVNRRYRRSATLNYCWYRQCQKGGMEDDGLNDASAAGGATWTRRASKMDWKTQYAKQRRIEAREAQRLESLPGSGTVTPSRTQRMRDEGIKTASEVRQDEWREQESQGYSKEEMREWYKNQGGSKGGKLKGKRGKGGAKTGADDGSLWQ